MQAYEVIICGAGVAGLTLALALGRQGRRVLLLDKQQKNLPLHKGEAIQPRTLQIFHELGLLAQLHADGALQANIFECRNIDGSLIGALDYSALPKPFNYILIHYYHKIKTALLKEVSHLVDFRQGVRVINLLKEGEQIVGVRIAEKQSGEEKEVRGNLVVGADGRLSFVRSTLNIEAPMKQYPHQLIAFDLANVTHLGPHVSAYLSPQGLRLLYPLPYNRARLYVQIETGAFRSIKKQGMQAWQQALLNQAEELQGIKSQLLEAANDKPQLFMAWRSTAVSWTAPGAVLIGDAAHSVHPMAAQGMNAAVADAWTLSEMIQKHAGSKSLTTAEVNCLLTAYEQFRRPHMAYISRLSHSMSLLCTTTSRWRRTLANRIVRSNRTNRRLQYILTYNMSGLGVRRFSLMDRIYQFGLWPDSQASTVQL